MRKIIFDFCDTSNVLKTYEVKTETKTLQNLSAAHVPVILLEILRQSPCSNSRWLGSKPPDPYGNLNEISGLSTTNNMGVRCLNLWFLNYQSRTNQLRVYTRDNLEIIVYNIIKISYNITCRNRSWIHFLTKNVGEKSAWPEVRVGTVTFVSVPNFRRCGVEHPEGFEGNVLARPNGRFWEMIYVLK